MYVTVNVNYVFEGPLSKGMGWESEKSHKCLEARGQCFAVE